MYVCMYVCMYVYTYVYVSIYTYMYIYIYMCISTSQCRIPKDLFHPQRRELLFPISDISRCALFCKKERTGKGRVHYEYVTLANKTSVLREAMLFVFEPRRFMYPTRVCRRILKPCETQLLFRKIYIRNSLYKRDPKGGFVKGGLAICVFSLVQLAKHQVPT